MRASRPWLTTAVLAVVVLVAPRLPAEETAAPARSRWYVVGLAGTTPAYRPAGGPWDGFQHDLSLNLGAGRFVGARWALELDVGATWVRGRYASAALTPGALVALHPNVYAAARVIVPFDPEADVVLFPGVGLIHTFRNGLAPFVEANLSRSLERRDLGVALTLGLLYNP